MAQVQTGSVRVENGSNVVRAIWRLTYVNLSGSFQPGEGLTWGVDGVGVFVRIATTTTELFLYRTAGSEPAVGDTITGGTSGATADVDALGADSPPKWDEVLNQIGITYRFSVAHSGKHFDVGSTVNRDNLAITVNYDDPTENEADYFVVQDYTALKGLPTPVPGDIDLETVISLLSTRLEVELILGEEGAKKRYTQAAHGFAIGDVVYYDASTGWTKAQANAEVSSRALGIVDDVILASFRLVMAGHISGLSALTPGTLYYLSPSTAGALTATKPATAGEFVKPMLLAVSTTAGVVLPHREEAV